MKLEIFNATGLPYIIVLEPIGDSFDIQPGVLSEIQLGNEDSSRLDIHLGNQLNIWTEGNVTVRLSDTTIEYPAMS